MSLKQLAKESEIGSHAGYAWELIVRGVESGMLVQEEIPELIAHLSQGRDFCVEELAFDFILGELEVRFNDESVPADRNVIKSALEGLLAKV